MRQDEATGRDMLCHLWLLTPSCNITQPIISNTVFSRAEFSTSTKAAKINY